MAALPSPAVSEIEASCLTCRHARPCKPASSNSVKCLETSEVHPSDHVCAAWFFLGHRSATGQPVTGQTVDGRYLVEGYPVANEAEYRAALSVLRAPGDGERYGTVTRTEAAKNGQNQLFLPNY